MPLFREDRPQYGGFPSPPSPSIFTTLRNWLHYGRRKHTGTRNAHWAPQYASVAYAGPNGGYQQPGPHPTHRTDEVSYAVVPSAPVTLAPIPHQARLRYLPPSYGPDPRHPYPYGHAANLSSASNPYTNSRQASDRRNYAYTAQPVYPHAPAHRNPHAYSYENYRGRHSERSIPAAPEYRSRSSSSVRHQQREMEEQRRHYYHTPQRSAQNVSGSSSSLPREREARDDPSSDHGVSQSRVRDNPQPVHSRTRSTSRTSHPGPSSEVHSVQYTLLGELIPSVTRYPSIDFNVCLDLKSAFKWTGPGATSPISFDLVATSPPVNELFIHSFKKNAALSLIVAKFGPIHVKAYRDVTVGDIIRSIWQYFHEPLESQDVEELDQKGQKYIRASFETRKNNQDKRVNGELWPKLTYHGPIRADMLFQSFQYAGLQMDEDFARNKKLLLTMENKTRPFGGTLMI